MSDEPILIFPAFFETSLKEKILSLSSIIKLKPETEILRLGQFVKQIPIVIQGSVKVIREDEDGKEILIYYIRKGESCALSFSAFLNNEQSQVKAVTTEETTLLAIPTQHIADWQKIYPSWQEFILKLYHHRFHEILATVDAIAFKKVDERLLHYLVEKKKIVNSDSFHITHQQIADDLGTSREVVSRLLKDLERKGMIQLGRNFLKVKSLM